MKKTINKLLTACLAVASVAIIGTTAIAQPAHAAGKCGDVDVSYIDFLCKDASSGSGDIEKSGIWAILTGVLNIMLAGVGVLAVGGIVYGAILYASAQDNQQQVQQAMTIFRNVVIGLVSFALMYSLLQFLIPGGIFGTLTIINLEVYNL